MPQPLFMLRRDFNPFGTNSCEGAVAVVEVKTLESRHAQ